MRKTPIKHTVKTHRRSSGKIVLNYTRGSGSKNIKISNPTIKPKEPDLIQKAKKYFGTTEDIKKAGFLLPDGTFLDFSMGEEYKWFDHRGIKNIFPEKQEQPVETFLKATGSLRFAPASRELNFEKVSSKPITEAQWQKIKSILKSDKMKEYVNFDVHYPSYTKSYFGFYQQNPHSSKPDFAVTLEQLKEKI